MEACLEADEEVQVARPVATPQHGSKASPGAEEAMSEDDLTLALASAFQKQMGGTGLDDEITDPYCQNDEWCKETMADSPDSFQMDQRFLQQDRCPDSGSSYFAGHVAESPGINGQPEVPDVVSTSTVGTQERQPLWKPATVEVPETEPFQSLIPNISDPRAPRPTLGQPHISQEAIRQRAKRIFMPRRDGSLKVSQEIFKEWKAKGKDRKNLEEIFKRCGYHAEAGI